MQRLTFVFLLFAVSLCSQVRADGFQRILVPPVSFSLNDKTPEFKARSFCADFDKDAPSGNAPLYTFVEIDQRCVTIGDKLMTLQEAIRGGFIELIADGFQRMIFVRGKNVKSPVKVSITKNVVLDNGDTRELPALTNFDFTNPTGSLDMDEYLQEKYWTKQYQIKSLADIKIIPGFEINNDSLLANAVKKFQVQNGLDPTGILNDELSDIAFAINKCNSYIVGGRTDNLQDVLKKFQNTYQIPETGIFDVATKTQIAKLDVVADRLDDSYKPNAYTPSQSEEFVNSLAYFYRHSMASIHYNDSTFVILPDETRQAGRYELIKRASNRTGKNVFEASKITAETIHDMDLQLETAVENYSSENNEIVYFGGLFNNECGIQIGKKKFILALKDNYASTALFVDTVSSLINRLNTSKNVLVISDMFGSPDSYSAYSRLLNNKNDLLPFPRINQEYLINRLAPKLKNKKITVIGNNLSSFSSFTKELYEGSLNNDIKFDVPITTKNPGAIIKYQTEFQRDNNLQIQQAKSSTNDCTESLFMCWYYIWAERNGKPTSDKSRKVYIDNDRKIEIEEGK